jgi:hypothetical protein
MTRVENNPGRPTRIVACGVFRPALDHLGVEAHTAGLRVSYLPAHLHLDPEALKGRIEGEFRVARSRRERVVCLYGQCAPGLSDLCRACGAPALPGRHCYEILLGAERCRGILEDNAGTYFLLKDLIVDFERLCVKPMELNDPQVRRWFFEHYRTLLYVRQPGDPDLSNRARELAAFLDLDLEEREADYSHLETWLRKRLGPAAGAEADEEG